MMMRLEPYLVSIATNILKRILEPHYDRLAWRRTVQQLRALPARDRKALETALYAVAAYIEVNMPARTPLREVLKRLFEDMPSEIGSRIVNRPVPVTGKVSAHPSLFTSLNRWCRRATRHLEEPLF